MKTPQPKTGPRGAEKMVVISIPEDLHTQVKIEAATQKTTLKGYIIQALRRSVEKKGTKP